MAHRKHMRDRRVARGEHPDQKKKKNKKTDKDKVDDALK